MPIFKKQLLYPYLSIAIVYESLPFIANHISEKGITKNSSDNSEPISNTELTNIQNHLRTQLEFLKMNFKKIELAGFKSFADKVGIILQSDLKPHLHVPLTNS